MRPLGIFVAQTTASWAVLMVILSIDVAIEKPPFDGGLASIGGPIGGAIIGVVTNAVVAALGAALRFFEPTARWLRGHGEVMILIAVAGIATVILSFVLGGPVVRPDDFGNPVAGFQPLIPLLATGWFVTAGAIVHTWWPGDDRKLPALANLSSTPEERELHRRLYGDPSSRTDRVP